MRLWLVLVSVFATLGTLSPMVAFAQEATPQANAAALIRTDTRYVIPFGPDGLNAGLAVRDTLTGTCVGDSIAVSDRADAFECLAEGSQIYDPCFENPFAPINEPGEVACVTDPFGTEVVLLTVEDPLPREKDAPPGQEQDPFAPWDLPWALELANGDRCTLLHGTLYQLGGQTVYYSCEQNGSVLGVVDHGQAVWTVNYLADGDVASSIVDVTVAWS
jgi:hypothetical protein